MDYSAANSALWNVIIQFGILALALLAANFLRRQLKFFRRSLLPAGVLGGFILLILKSVGLLRLDGSFLEMVAYHFLAIAFIAMSLRVNVKDIQQGEHVGLKSGALIVSVYLVQAITGILVCLVLAYTFMPGLFKAAGVLLPLGYGQGPGQAGNIGSTYEALGFQGGHSFGLALAASGFLVASVVGVIMLNILAHRGQIRRVEHEQIADAAVVGTFQDKGEMPIAESLDRFSMQMALVLVTYLVTYLVTWGITSGIGAVAPGLGETVNTLLWGFNFIIGSMVATLLRVVLGKLRSARIMTRQYQNNYLLSRISGMGFDIMCVAGIASIEISDLAGLWVPFILLSAAGAAVTWFYLRWMCKKLYPGYYYEGLMSMYGMLTGTISSAALLLREIDPEFKTPAADNLVIGSAFGIAFGFPVLILVGLAPKGDGLLFTVLGACVVYLAALVTLCLRLKGKNKSE